MPCNIFIQMVSYIETLNLKIYSLIVMKILKLEILDMLNLFKKKINLES